MAPRVGNSVSWYSDSGNYMSEINEYLRSRPESGLVDEFARHDDDDDWERLWMQAPEVRIREVFE